MFGWLSVVEQENDISYCIQLQLKCSCLDSIICFCVADEYEFTVFQGFKLINLQKHGPSNITACSQSVHKDMVNRDKLMIFMNVSNTHPLTGLIIYFCLEFV